MSGQKIAWIDLETTGLDPSKGVILEVSCVVTDMEGSETGELSLVIHRDVSCLKMDAFVTEMHNKSNLLSLVQESEYTTELAESMLAGFIKDQRGEGSPLLLGGSSVHYDRAWLSHHMPDVLSDISHRHIDSTSLCYTAEQRGIEVGDWSKHGRHRALEDIRCSISVYTDMLKILKKVTP